jgi:hypothetical protein
MTDFCNCLRHIHKGFHFGQTPFREVTNEIERDWVAFETITIIIIRPVKNLFSCALKSALVTVKKGWQICRFLVGFVKFAKRLSITEESSFNFLLGNPIIYIYWNNDHRNREVDIPASGRGRACKGRSEETKICLTQICPGNIQLFIYAGPD